MLSRKEFWFRVKKGGHNDCWLWTGHIAQNGYGRIGTDGAHRRAWSFANKRPVPNGKFVLHRCDVRACVNPAHLFLGTQSDNMKDMVSKNRRTYENYARGEHHPKAKLTDDLVRQILLDSRPNKQIATALGIQYQTVWRIKTRNQWRHIHV